MTMSKDKNGNEFYDFSKEYKDYAIFLPAISAMYSKYVAHPQPKRLPPKTIEIEQMNFLQKENQNMFYVPNALYSAGQVAKTDSMAKIKDIDMVLNGTRDKKSIIIGDSAGFQIQEGSIKWEGKRTLKRILEWLEQNCEWAMILDFPTGSIRIRGNTLYEEIILGDDLKPTYDYIPDLDADGNEQFSKNGKLKMTKKQKKTQHKLDFWFCLDRTIENNDYFIKHRTPGRTKFLNVLQGRSQVSIGDVSKMDYANLPREKQKELLENGQISECDAWYECVKHFSDPAIYGDRAFEGWALAGFHKENFSATLKRIIIQLHEGQLKEKEWMHFLGMGKPQNACVYTDLQRNIRKHENGNKNFTISFDASSPFTSAAFGRVYSGSVLNNKRWGFNVNELGNEDALIGGPDANEKVFCRGPAKFDENGEFIDHLGKHFSGKPGRLVKDEKTGEEIEERIYLEGPVVDKLIMSDICVNTDPALTSSWDVCSYALMMQHNVYMQIKTILDAQKLYELPYNEAIDVVPIDLLSIKSLIAEIFTVDKDTALDKINNNAKLLNALGTDWNADMISAIENPDIFKQEHGKFEKVLKVKIVKEKKMTSTYDELFS